MKIIPKTLKNLLVVFTLLFSACGGMCGNEFSIIAEPDTMDILKKQSSSLSHDSNGALYCIYNAGDGTYEVRGRKITDSETTDLGVIGYYDDTYDGYKNSRIAFDSSRVPYVIYAGHYAGQLSGHNSYYIYVKKYNGDGWDQVGTTDVANEQRPELAAFSIGADDTPYVSYRNSPGGELSVKSMEG